mmetsp:Transcript_12284/g.25079  ORF Transcript_12284/g.25079 Transcript_12284/m.25079 type:complete len:299 (+) Transcript_12284:1970-2866(+)
MMMNPSVAFQITAATTNNVAWNPTATLRQALVNEWTQPKLRRTRLCAWTGTMMEPLPRSVLRVSSGTDQVGSALTSWIQSVQDPTSNNVTIAVSGGSLPRILADGLARAGLADSLCPNWTVLFADERLVPLDHPDSNYRLAQEALGEESVRRYVPLDPSLLHDPTACATDYMDKLMQSCNGMTEVHPPSLDIILLGLGPDGHTASLFPGHPLLEETQQSVACITDSPKPPPSRITLTLPVLNAARHVAFVVTGASKAEAIRRIFQEPNCGLPGQMVRPTSSNLVWFVDDAAASQLQWD